MKRKHKQKVLEGDNEIAHLQVELASTNWVKITRAYRNGNREIKCFYAPANFRMRFVLSTLIKEGILRCASRHLDSERR